jgi:hypothetical protein
MTTISNPNSKLNLIRDFFGATLQEMKQTTPEDRDQLASAIAKSKGLTEQECGFAFMAY